ncbi:hypothetical protein GCM10012284_55670 [Mangrovihabitans endophyticus]|uniref:Uncharacterized protein n=1 Tax=Mangrovihabitans endophyticus TaxID=1751298 RepID=A0A8J3C3L2_9ACTN|nr:hypothetical protein GCM10012284_55670 [Mangrovihabitans endophyticus]
MTDNSDIDRPTASIMTGTLGRMADDANRARRVEPGADTTVIDKCCAVRRKA